MALRSLLPWLQALTCLHGSCPSSTHGPQVTALPSLRSLVLVSLPRCLGTARGYPGRKDTACAVVPLSCSLVLLLLLLNTFVGAVSHVGAADCGNKELGDMSYVLADAAAQRLLDLKSSGA